MSRHYADTLMPPPSLFRLLIAIISPLYITTGCHWCHYYLPYIDSHCQIRYAVEMLLIRYSLFRYYCCWYWWLRHDTLMPHWLAGYAEILPAISLHIDTHTLPLRLIITHITTAMLWYYYYYSQRYTQYCHSWYTYTCRHCYAEAIIADATYGWCYAYCHTLAWVAID